MKVGQSTSGAGMKWVTLRASDVDPPELKLFCHPTAKKTMLYIAILSVSHLHFAAILCSALRQPAFIYQHSPLFPLLAVSFSNWLFG